MTRLDDFHKRKLEQVKDDIALMRQYMVQELILELSSEFENETQDKMDFNKKKKLSDRYDLLRELLDKAGIETAG